MRNVGFAFAVLLEIAIPGAEAGAVSNISATFLGHLINVDYVAGELELIVGEQRAAPTERLSRHAGRRVDGGREVVFHRVFALWPAGESRRFAEP